jgi:acyl-CoA oxidase
MKNTKLQAFIPLFYLVWSDDLLTQKEFATIQQFINDLVWLSSGRKTTIAF